MQILCSLRSAISLVYNKCRKHSTKAHLNVNCTKMQHSITATFTTIIHNKLI